jgi:hypothetical protein
MRKINDFKNDALKVKRVQKTFKNLNSFLDNAENAKNDANISRTYILLGFCCFFAIFVFFSKIYQKLGKKLGRNTDCAKSTFFLICLHLIALKWVLITV